MGAYLSFDGQDFYFDAVLSEQAEHTAEATEHAVEQGANVADHVRPGLDRITLEVAVSNTPIKDVNNLYGATTEGIELDPLEGRQKATGHSDTPKGPFPVSPGAAFQAIGNAISGLIGGSGPAKATVVKFGGAPFDAVRDTLNQLLDWQHRAVVGEVITPHRTYSSMIIERVAPRRDSSTGAGAELVIDLREVRLVETSTITVPIPTETRGKTIKQKGRQPSSFVRDPGPKKSVLTALKEKFGG